ncbi:MAG: DUF58 domain-containing protein [Gemmatimonadetes bacterium]|nr:DUF58 domain-containing protein [Gemmatimonadota bacterium]
MGPVAPPRRPALEPALLAPAELLALGGLDLVSRLVVDGYLSGRHRSPNRGGSLEFAEHRPYVRGDDLRRVDWKVYGRTDRFFIRQSDAETNLRATLAIDASASMGFSAGGRPSKWAYGCAVAAALTHLLLAQHDGVGLAVFDAELKAFLPPGATQAQRIRILDTLEGLEPAGETEPADPFRQLAERLPRRGLLVLISDLLGPPEAFLPGLRYFRHRKHEVVVFHVLDPVERTLEGLGETGALADVETGQVVRAAPAALARGYREELAALEATYRAQAHDQGFDFVPLTTDEPLGPALARYLHGRRTTAPASSATR